MDQTNAIVSLLDDMDMPYNSGVLCPMPLARCLHEDSEELEGDEVKRYQKLVGALNYFACTTRYDIAHAVSRLGQYNANPGYCI